MEHRNGFVVDSSRDSAYLHTMLEHALMSLGEICIVDEHGKYLYASEEYARSMGFPVDELIGKSVTDLVDDTGIPDVLKSGQATRGAIYQRNGRSFWLNRCPIRYGGRIMGVVGQAMMTDSEEMTALRCQFDKMIRELNYYKEKYQQDSTTHFSTDSIITVNKEMTALKETLTAVARSRSTILLSGESGTGKEVFANAIHDASPRKNKPFIKLNCAAIPDALLEAQLFGYEEGSFTGALKGGKIGDFEAANGGTILLDEINSLSMNMQTKLLRAIQEREIKKVGSSRTVPVDVRFIFATNRDLFDMVKNGTFREDFYYRINVINLEIPPLRRRPEDIPVLVQHFIRKFNREMDMAVTGITPRALSLLQRYDWPGNIRELENQIERAFNYLHGSELDIQHFNLPIQQDMPEDAPMLSLREARNRAEAKIIRQALDLTHGNKPEAAKLLGIDRSQLYEKIKRYQILSPGKAEKGH